jgi:hypothetical protein
MADIDEINRSITNSLLLHFSHFQQANTKNNGTIDIAGF